MGMVEGRGKAKSQARELEIGFILHDRQRDKAH